MSSIEITLNKASYWKSTILMFLIQNILFLFQHTSLNSDRSSQNVFELPYAHHYNPRFVYFLPTF